MIIHADGVSFIIGRCWKAKETREDSNISPCKNVVFKKSSKRNQNLSRYENSITNLKFQHKPKYHLSKKSSYIKNRPIIIT
jgi:hypothetical protein